MNENVSAGGEAIYLHQDVSVEESWPGVIEATERRFGRLNVMVANAGIGILCKAVEMSLADWRRQTAVNLDGVFLSMKYAGPAMRRAGGGSIIITSSVAGLRGSAGLAGYCATKGGVRLFAKAVAMECTAEGDGIRVNTVHPGVIAPIWTKIQHPLLLILAGAYLVRLPQLLRERLLDPRLVAALMIGLLVPVFLILTFMYMVCLPNTDVSRSAS